MFSLCLACIYFSTVVFYYVLCLSLFQTEHLHQQQELNPPLWHKTEETFRELKKTGQELCFHTAGHMFNVWGHCLDHHRKTGDLTDSLSLTLTQQHWRPTDGRGQLTTSCCQPPASQSLAKLCRTADTSTQAAQFRRKKIMPTAAANR